MTDDDIELLKQRCERTLAFTHAKYVTVDVTLLLEIIAELRRKRLEEQVSGPQRQTT